ncbi:hypothetical protein [uncultured Phenylobacterium sp.]|uniref:hypothetical protein n=1 Tax=uncultured Phenylobacterium sp. TaxID=349273 RepID=UPI0025D809FA|nr:hypothetical protein [uncultured Phenylobacterium sp.]
MRGIIIGVALAIAAAGTARAADYVVVKSTDPAIKAGLTLSAGQRVNLAPGQTLTLIAAAGDVTTLKGGAAGAVAPVRRSQGDSARLEALRVLIDPPPTGRTFGGRRGGVCPDPTTLKTLDDILAVQRGDCARAARAALEAYATKN